MGSELQYQEQQVLDWLIERTHIDHKTAWDELDVQSIQAVVHRLRQHGYNIRTENVFWVGPVTGQETTFARYHYEGVTDMCCACGLPLTEVRPGKHQCDNCG